MSAIYESTERVPFSLRLGKITFGFASLLSDYSLHMGKIKLTR